MNDRSTDGGRDDQPRPLDHLRPGEESGSDATPDGAPPDGARPKGGAEPAEGVTPGGGAADAVRGKATRSPADVGTRPHLQGSEQGPR